ncbi:hypothetical protein FACS1894190_07440 [Spirochaetia bacterium]|nr:hypothetical protein FACS1894190_07440 [Spirochaetia bacterium]
MYGATIGKLGITTQGMCTNQACCVLSTPIDISINFSFYTFFAMRKYLLSIAYGGGQPNISHDTIKSIRVCLPSIKEQHAICTYLDSRCFNIDKSIELQKSSIKKLQEYKKAIITEAVTKGLNPNVPMKDSGIEWIGKLPEEWEIKRLKFFANTGDGLHGTPEYDDNGQYYFINGNNLGSQSIKIDSDTKSISKEEFVKYEIKLNNKSILISLNGTIGNLSFYNNENIILSKSAGYVTINDDTNKTFLYFYLQNENAKRVFELSFSGTTINNLSLYTLRNLVVLLPPVVEQQAITDYLDKKCATIDKTIAEKRDLIEKLTEYKKSLIYEAVTGKIEMPVADSNIIQFPAIFNSNKKRFVQATLMSKILDSFGNEVTGRVKLEKTIFTIEHHIGFDFDTSYKREIAGPLDRSIYECEGIISKRNKWFSIQYKYNSISYRPTKEKDKYKQYYNKYFNQYNGEIERIIAIFKPFTMDQAEIIATLYAAWNDAIIKGENFTDKDIVRDVTNNWKDTKGRFADDIWLRAMDKMREFALIPKGYGKPTQRVIGKRNKSPKAKEENS